MAGKRADEEEEENDADDEKLEDEEDRDDETGDAEEDLIEQDEDAADEESEADDARPLAGEELNAELFRTAAASLREAIPAWKMQADLLIGHPVEFAPDFDSLEGRYERMQPFVHVAIAGVLEALVKVRFDPTCGSKLTLIQRIVICGLAPEHDSGDVLLNGGTLIVSVPLAGTQPPTEQIAAAMSTALGGGVG